MKGLLSIFIALGLLVPSLAPGAVSVKKASSVKTQETAPVDSATSLLPTVIGLVGNVKTLNAQQQQLTAECVPTNDEIKVVNDLVKEWAKIGDTDAETAASGLGRPCSDYVSDSELQNYYEDGTYQTFMDSADKKEVCYERFIGKTNDGMIWFKFPKASSAKVCDVNNAKNCKTVSNLYDIFAKIPFNTEDYTKSEASKIARLVAKSEKCAPSKISAAKRELWGGFLTQTLGSVGKSTGASGTESVIQAVSSAGGGRITSMLPSLGQMATQALEK